MKKIGVLAIPAAAASMLPVLVGQLLRNPSLFSLRTRGSDAERSNGYVLVQRSRRSCGWAACDAPGSFFRTHLLSPENA